MESFFMIWSPWFLLPLFNSKTSFFHASVSRAACPDKATDLKNWSEATSWPNGVPAEGDDVIINSLIALDASPGVDLGSITIVTGGRLVFLPNSNLTLRTKYIEVKGGRMDIGSADCLYEGEAKIQLLGSINDTYSVPGFGQKFLGVNVDGTLEIHGQRKLSWTKLTSPVQKLTDSAFASYDAVTREDDVKGFIVNSYNPVTGVSDRPRGDFMIGRSHQKGIEKETDRLIQYVNDIPDGNVVMLAVRKFIIDRENAFDRSVFYNAVEILGYGKVTNASKIRDLVFYDSFAMIVVKGDYSKTIESFEPYKVGGVHQTSSVSMLSDDKSIKFFVESYTRSIGFGASTAIFEVTYTDKSIPKITVSDSVASWQVGDKIIITSTDYDWRQVEEGTIFPCTDCADNQIRVDLSPRFNHYAAITNNVDMRAEVGLLSRNIIIEGDMENADDEFGGHIKVLKGFKNFHIQGAEIRHMGQSNTLGSYPVHWHICEGVNDQAKYPVPTYARENAIHNSYARCVTVHATHGVTVADNVCYKSIGHAYFLEDGGETGTIFTGNLGVGQTQGELIPTDNLPTTFWITNPLTTLENNVAAGSDGFGIWYIFPFEPLGSSRGKGYMAPDEARHTAITKFYNNIAHSNKFVGLKMEDSMDENGTRIANNRYEPWNDPIDETSGNKKVDIVKLTAYKNRYFNVITRGLIEITQSSIADSVNGVQLLRWRTGGQLITNSVIIGDSDNLGNPDEDGEIRSLPKLVGGPRPRKGLVFGIGPTIARNVWFDGFANTTDMAAGAISFQDINGMFSSPGNVLENVGFGFDDSSEGNRVYQNENPEDYRDGSKSDRFLDASGSVTSVPGASVVRATPFQMTSNCVKRNNWGMAVCKEHFAQVLVKVDKGDTATMMRTDDLQTNRQTSDTFGQALFNVVTGGTYSYLVKFGKILPKDFFQIRGMGMAVDQDVVLGLCVPKDLVFKAMVRKPGSARMTEVDSVDLVNSGDGSKFYFDREVGVLFVKLSYDGGKSKTTIMGFARLETKNRQEVDCESAYSTKYGATQQVAQGSLTLPAELLSTPIPPQNAGAGSTRP